jgi:hypothetical protein
MKKIFVYLLSMCFLFFIASASHSNELKTLDRLTSADINPLLKKVAFLHGIEKTENFYILCQEKARLFREFPFEYILELPEDTVLWLLSYGNDNGHSLLLSLLGKNLTCIDVKSKRLTQFTKEYKNLFEDIGKAYEKLTGEKTLNTEQLIKALRVGSSPRYAVNSSILKEGAALGIICYLGAKKYYTTARNKKSFIKDISAIEIKYADLFNDGQSNPWTYALLSYSKYVKESKDYLQVLRKIENDLTNYEISYEKRRTLEDGIIILKGESVEMDKKIRNIIFDLPILTLINYTNAKIDSAKGIINDDERMMLSAGVQFSKTSSFLGMMVDNEIRDSWKNIAGRLKKELNKNEYASLDTDSKVRRQDYGFNEKNPAVEWP